MSDGRVRQTLRSMGFALVALALACASGCERGTVPSAPPIVGTGASTIATLDATTASPTPAHEDIAVRFPGLAEVREGEERDAVAACIERVLAGGPFPYPAKDGTVFGNFEGRLPARARGHYREYTVPTPGLSHRGARRIVAGRTGEMYYTRDHYETFRKLTP